MIPYLSNNTAIEIGWETESNCLLIGILPEVLEMSNEMLGNYSGRLRESYANWHILPWAAPSEEGWGFGQVLKPYSGPSTLRFPGWAMDMATWAGDNRKEQGENSFELLSRSATLHAVNRVISWAAAENKISASRLVPNLIHLGEIRFSPELGCGFGISGAIFPAVINYIEALLPEEPLSHFSFVQIHAPSLAMQSAWRAMTGEAVEIGECSRRVGVFIGRGGLFLHCGRDRSSIYIPPGSSPDKETGSFPIDDHNIDCPENQLVSLVGMANLVDAVRRMDGQ